MPKIWMSCTMQDTQRPPSLVGLRSPVLMTTQYIEVGMESKGVTWG